jgi:hypothetical protein
MLQLVQKNRRDMKKGLVKNFVRNFRFWSKIDE